MERVPLKSKGQIEEKLQEIASQEQVYSIALFDILGFSNFVQQNGNQVVLDLYNKLLDIVEKQKSTPDGNVDYAGSVVPVPISEDWKNGALIANANGYVNVCHFSDTFLIYVNYQLSMPSYWLANTIYEPYPLLLGEKGTITYPVIYEQHHIYLSFLQTCMEFFCQAIIAGVPLRGCISSGLAIMDLYKSIYLGQPLVEAARGETAQNAIGLAFGKSFNNSHPVYNKYFIPYLNHIKEDPKSKYLSPMMVDWARYWRESPEFKEFDLEACINKMNSDSNFSSYNDNAVKFYKFSELHKEWFNEINRDEIEDITDYYEKVKKWYKEQE